MFYKKNTVLLTSHTILLILFELKKYRGVIFHETEERYKTCRGIDLSFQNWHKEFDKFDLSARKSKKFPL